MELVIGILVLLVGLVVLVLSWRRRSRLGPHDALRRSEAAERRRQAQSGADRFGGTGL